MRKILIVDDHEVVREGVKRIFDKQPDGATIGEAGTAAEALQLIQEQDWDVVILDLSLGHRNGLDVLRELKQLRPALPVLILTLHSEEQFARRAFKAGAAGYVTKGSPRSELTLAVDKVIGGGRYCSPSLAEKLIADLGAGGSALDSLTPRQQEILRLIGEGQSTKKIALNLGISGKTVEAHRAQLMNRLEIYDIAGLVRYAIKNGLIKLED